MNCSSNVFYESVAIEISLDRCDMKEISISIDRGEGGEEKEKERKKKESVYIEIFTILNKNGLGEQENRF